MIMKRTLAACAAMFAMPGCCAVGAGIGAVTSHNAENGAVAGAMIGGVADMLVWPTVGSLGAYPGSICAPPADVSAGARR